jgi:KUP system potassium uptake protein
MKVAWRWFLRKKLQRVDSLNLEAGRVSFSNNRHSNVDWKTTMRLALQSLGVVYGDIGTSPLYVFSSTFSDGIKHDDDILGVLSLIIYTIILIPLIKYVFIVLWANDHGDGGTFAMYSLISRHARVSFIPNDEPEDQQLSNYKIERTSNNSIRASNIKDKLENSTNWRLVLFLFTILGTSMVIGDGVLTPCISVLSAVSGVGSLGEGAVVGISVAILVILFYVQRFGTDKVGYTFAPIVCIWFSLIAAIGLYNHFTYGWGVTRAFNPYYIFLYFTRNGKNAWISLGGVVLCITGTEAMFADLGHFNVRAIQISFSGIVMPALLTAYSGQAAYLTRFPQHVDDTFYKSVPDAIYWPTFVVAVCASIIASQALISGAFAIVSQSLSLGCFPRVKVVHTSAEYEGQVYIPEINYLLMIACVLVVLAFSNHRENWPCLWNCCCCGDDHHNMYACSYYASNMENKHFVDHFIFHNFWMHRSDVFLVGVVQICTRWIPSIGIIICAHVNNGDVALRPQTKVHV